MFKEYALDPGLLTNWRDFRYYTEKFGWDRGRLLSEYPKKWKRLVYNAIAEESFINRKRIEESLRQIDDRLIRRRNSPFDPSLANDGSLWVRNAVLRHEELTFQAIITDDFGLTGEQLIIGEKMDETHPLMQVDSGIIYRRANDFAEAAKILLQAGQHLAFVDPYFNPGEDRFSETLSSLLQVAMRSPYRIDTPGISLHTGIGKNDRNDSSVVRNKTNELKRQCEYFLPQILPEDTAIEVFIWLPYEGGERFHNRYIMTELAGLCLGTGVDEEDSRPRNSNTTTSTDDWFRMSGEQHIHRWHQFQPTTCPFQQLDRFQVSRSG